MKIHRGGTYKSSTLIALVSTMVSNNCHVVSQRSFFDQSGKKIIEPSRVLGTLNAMGVDIETIKEGDGGIPAFFNVH